MLLVLVAYKYVMRIHDIRDLLSTINSRVVQQGCVSNGNDQLLVRYSLVLIHGYLLSKAVSDYLQIH
jgi:hypothetical protein